MQFADAYQVSHARASRAAGYPVLDAGSEEQGTVVTLEELLDADPEMSAEDRVAVERFVQGRHVHTRVSVLREHIQRDRRISPPVRADMLAILDGRAIRRPRPSRRLS